MRVGRGVIVIADGGQVREGEHGNEHRAGGKRPQPSPGPPEDAVSQRQDAAVNNQVESEQDRQARAEHLEQQPVGVNGQRPVSPGRLVKKHPPAGNAPGGVPLRPGVNNRVRPLPPRRAQKILQQRGQQSDAGGFPQPGRPGTRRRGAVRFLFRGGWHAVVVRQHKRNPPRRSSLLFFPPRARKRCGKDVEMPARPGHNGPVCWSGRSVAW